MKNILITVTALIGIASINAVFAADEQMHDMHQSHEMSVADMRTSLKLPAAMKQHQLSNMRGHVEAVKNIVGLMAENRFEEASAVAHARLGMTPEMLAMCDRFDNEQFRLLGRAFHKSGDDLGDALQTKDINASLHALNKTMQYCVDCHAAFRQ